MPLADPESVTVAEDLPARPRWLRQYALALVLFDAASAVLSGLAADVVRFGPSGGQFVTREVVVPYAVVAVLAVPVWIVFLGASGAYNTGVLGVGAEEHRRVLNAGLRFTAAIAFISFVADLGTSRGFVGLAILFVIAFTLLGRQAAREWLHRQRRRGRYSREVLVVGSEENVVRLVRHLRRAPYAGYSVLGAAVPGNRLVIHVDGDPVPVLADPAHIYDALENTQADAIAVTDISCLPEGALQRLSWHMEGSGVDLIVAPSITDVAGPRVSIRPLAGLPLLHVEEPELSGARLVVKGLLDRLAASLALLLLSPLMVAIAVAVKTTSPGRVAFRQTRVGKDGRHFSCWKFRSMYPDAEQRRSDLTAQNESDEVLFKMRHDPRVTPVGRWIRRFSLDELPQLWNVVKGDMSLVGPRPPIPSEVEEYETDARRRLLVKPGLTGLWQVSGRSDLPWHETVRLDLYYVENYSPTLDLMILWKTVWAVLTGRGAY